MEKPPVQLDYASRPKQPGPIARCVLAFAICIGAIMGGLCGLPVGFIVREAIRPLVASFYHESPSLINAVWKIAVLLATCSFGAFLGARSVRKAFSRN